MRGRGVGPHKPFELLGDYLRAEQGLGRLNAEFDPRSAADLLMGTCFQQTYLAHFYGEEIPETTIAEFARQSVDALLRGLTPTT